MIGRTISHYKILEEVGRGGMGVVYKAEDTRLHRIVALKFLPPQTDPSGQVTGRLEREAQAAASLNHPNIATVFEYDEVDDPAHHTPLSFIAMEYVDGTTLRELIDRGPIPFSRVRSILNQIVAGLQEAHAKGIVHRDIKPTNIILTPDGTAKLLDFGVAQIAAERTQTRPSDIVGSAPYMSPEQIQGEHVEHQSDFWSMGVVLFEMLTGSRPFAGDHVPALFYRICNEEPKAPKSLVPDVPEDLAQICSRCMSKDPARRPQSAAEILSITTGRMPTIVPRGTLLRVILMVGAIAMIAAILHYGWRSIFPGSQGMRLGVLLFTNQTSEPSTDDWPSLLQVMLTERFQQLETVAVVDPLSMNEFLESSFGATTEVAGNQLSDVVAATGATLLLDGVIRLGKNGYVIQTRLMNSETHELLRPRELLLSDEHDLNGAVDDLAEELFNFFEVSSLTRKHQEDLRPWVGRHPHPVGAVREFLQANQYIFSGLPGAGRHLERSLELDSAFIAPRIWLISGLVIRGKQAEALHHLSVLRELEATANPFEQAMIGWADSYVRSDLAGQARYLTLALDYSPRNNVLLYNLARTKLLLKDPVGASETILPTITMKWQFSPAYFLLASAYESLDRTDDAQRVLEQSLVVEPVYWDIHKLLACYALRAGDTVKATAHERNYFVRGKTFGLPELFLHHELGKTYLERGYPQRAIRIFTDAMNFSHTDPGTLFLLGESQYQDGQLLKSLESFSKALQRDPYHSSSRKRLGDASNLLGRTLEAATHYKMFLLLDSLSTEAAAVRESLLVIRAAQPQHNREEP